MEIIAMVKISQDVDLFLVSSKYFVSQNMAELH